MGYNLHEALRQYFCVEGYIPKAQIHVAVHEPCITATMWLHDDLGSPAWLQKLQITTSELGNRSIAARNTGLDPPLLKPSATEAACRNLPNAWQEHRVIPRKRKSGHCEEKQGGGCLSGRCKRQTVLHQRSLWIPKHLRQHPYIMVVLWLLQQGMSQVPRGTST